MSKQTDWADSGVPYLRLRLEFGLFFIAAPVAYFLVEMWQEGFVYKVGLSAWVFIVSELISLVVAFITLSFRSVKAAIRWAATSCSA